MKKIIMLFFVAAILSVVFSANVYAGGVKELELDNYIDMYPNKVIASPKGDLLLIHDAKKNMYLYNINSGIEKELMIETAPLGIEQMCFSSDSSLLAAKKTESWDSYKSSVCVFDTKSGELLNEIYLVGSARAIAFDKKNNLIATYLDTKINVIDIFTGEVLVKMDGNSKMLQQNPINSHIASVTFLNMVRIYDSTTGASLKTLECGSYTNGLVYSPNGKYLAVSCDSKTLIFDVENKYRKKYEINCSGRISFNTESDIVFIGDRAYFANDDFKDYIQIKDNDYDVDVACGFLVQDGKYYINYSYNRQGIRILDCSSLIVRLQEIRLEPDKIELLPEEELDIKLIGVYSDGSTAKLNLQEAKCVISDFSIATVKNYSKIKGLTVGKAELSITYYGKTFKTVIEVVPKKSKEVKNP